VDRPQKEYYYEYLKEWVHYIPVKRDLSDVVEKVQWCVDNYDKAQEIADNAYKFSQKYLTREACYFQWNKIICNL
jgi:glycosyltransferase involved in cell wall biosynthesis